MASLAPPQPHLKPMYTGPPVSRTTETDRKEKRSAKLQFVEFTTAMKKTESMSVCSGGARIRAAMTQKQGSDWKKHFDRWVLEDRTAKKIHNDPMVSDMKYAAIRAAVYGTDAVTSPTATLPKAERDRRRALGQLNSKYRSQYRAMPFGRIGWHPHKAPAQKRQPLRNQGAVVVPVVPSGTAVVSHHSSLFDDILAVHVNMLGHDDSHDKLYQLCKLRHGNTITKAACRAFRTFCPVCGTRAHNVQRRAGGGFMVHYRYNRRLQMDVVDMQGHHDSLVNHHMSLPDDHPEKKQWAEAHAAYARVVEAEGLQMNNATHSHLMPRYMVTLIDHASKLRRYYAVATKKPSVLSNILCHYASTYGGFDFLHTDNGSDVRSTAGHCTRAVGKNGLSGWDDYREGINEADLNQVLTHVRQ